MTMTMTNAPTAPNERPKAAETATPATPAAPAAPLSPTIEQIVRRTEYERRFEPMDRDAGWELALCAAKANICGVKAPEDAYMRIIKGAAIGLPAMASIENIHPLWQKSAETHVYCMSAAAKVGLLLSRKDVIAYIRPKPGACSNTSATWIGRRVGQDEPEQEYTFSMEDAQIAGLVGRGPANKSGQSMNNYDRHPGPMCNARAKGRLAHILGEDILMGIATAEEIADDNDVTSQLRAASEEVIDRVQKKTLDQKLAERSAAQPSAGAPSRDWAAEADALKTSIVQSIETNSATEKRSVAAAWKAFKAAAPEAFSADVWRFYSTVRGDKSKDKPPPADEPKPEGSPKAPGSLGFGPPRAEAAVHDGREPPPGSLSSDPPRGQWLPPSARGDAYDGPENEEPFS